MPSPSRTSVGAIVRAGGEVLEAAGLPGLTMQAVAVRVGVRSPSLYKHVEHRDALVRLVAEAAVADLAELLEGAAPPGTEPRAALAALAEALRTFARSRPAAFAMVITPGAEAVRPRPEVAARAVAPVLRVAGELAGPEHALMAARTVTAWASGFLALELADAFRAGGDPDEAFAYGVERLADALARREP